MFTWKGAHLFRLLLADVGTTQHGGFDGRQDFELSADSGNALTHLKPKKNELKQWKSGLSHEEDRTDLEQVGPDPFVGALLGDLLGQPGDLIGSLGDVLGALDEGTLVSTTSTHQAGHLCHEQGHSLGSTDDVIALQSNSSKWIK